MRYLRTDGKELKRYQWKCGICQNDIIPNLCQVEGGPPFPYDIPINCGNCAQLVAIFNPSVIEAPEAPGDADERKGDPADPLGDGLHMDTLTDQDGRLHPDVANPTSAKLAEPKIIEAAIAPEPEPEPEPDKLDDKLEPDPPKPEPKHKKSTKFW